MFPLHQTPEKKMKRRHCPTRKMKHFNEAWAKIAAKQQEADFGGSFRTYRCSCGWWHTYDRRKKRIKDDLREKPNARKKRAKRGEPPPLQTLLEQQRREQARARKRQKRARKEIPIRVWEDDGGACVWPSGCPD